ncbi:MAG: hypothetical protein K6G87_15950 [Butyrivibrio sp.]|uniref:hypothetical protein n=1 Tax=Butyrivibrio sp. TaxID=28121 RepID=UPI0025F9FBC9|nr:hypothetical protein [Butyrivibrio sp.]MCR5772714.1 hypothetical protein [Butyrivibrio sp.]
MKKKMLSIVMSLFLIINMLIVPVYAEGETETDPAPVKSSYEFNGVKYVYNGDKNFNKNQFDYYMSMLTNSPEDIGLSKPYTIYDMWTILGMEMLIQNGNDSLRNNIFKGEKDIIDDEARFIIENNYASADKASVSSLIRKNFNDGLWEGIPDIDYNFYREHCSSASDSQTFAKGVARSAVSHIVNNDGETWNLDESMPVTINSDHAPELKGPVYYSVVGISGNDLNFYTKNSGNFFHGAVIAFSDFSITPVIPDENAEQPYAYVTTAIGTPSEDEEKVVSDVKNYSGETINASQTVSESESSTITSSISGSTSTSTTDSYSISDTVKVGAKFTFEQAFEVGSEVSTTTTSSHSVTDTVTKGWSSSEGTTAQSSESRTISISLPPYTTALMSQQHYKSEALASYNCPAALNFKVTVYYSYGKLTNNFTEAEISFEKLTEFGATSDARTDLAKRYQQTTGSSGMVDVDYINWNDLSKYKSIINVLSTIVPFDSTPATFTQEVSLVKTEVEDILPIYPIDAIKFVNPDSVLHNKPYLSEINMEVGDTDNSSNYNLRALNQYGADFYTFYKQNGRFVILDENGEDITETGNDVIKTDVDKVTGAIRFKAVGEGTAYLRYKINNGLYRTASMAASNTPEDYIDDSEIAHPAILRINVTDTGHRHSWLKPTYVWSDDNTVCTAYCKCKYDDSHIKQEASDVKIDVVKAPTATEDGLTVYTAEFETEGFEKQTKNVIVPATGVIKKANPLRIKGKTVSVKYSKLKKKAQTLAVGKLIKFTKKAKDQKTYKIASVKKGKKSFKKYFKINSKTGKMTIKKNKKLKKGTYKVVIKVKAKGNSSYNASAVKKVTVKIKIK